MGRNEGRIGDKFSVIIVVYKNSLVNGWASNFHAKEGALARWHTSPLRTMEVQARQWPTARDLRATGPVREWHASPHATQAQLQHFRTEGSVATGLEEKPAGMPLRRAGGGDMIRNRRVAADAGRVKSTRIECRIMLRRPRSLAAVALVVALAGRPAALAAQDDAGSD